MQVSRNKVERVIENRLTEAMRHNKPPIGSELAKYLGEWGQWQGNRGSSCSTSDWHVNFLKWALAGRADKFKHWADQRETYQIKKAMAAIQTVYAFYWPRNLTGHLFGQLWGWLQVELKKPGVPKPPSIPQQMESLKKHAKENGQRITKWNFIGNCVTAVLEELNSECKKGVH